ncbi:flagellar protein export ATPase FliI [Aquisalimonas lutea]|uniref:flagellar protein export ATPase FliI n=1 Tax=Aquisalimonas lutea TaxID=1327750 RepID=UPI0025B33192|nr:flagellar protein export ATPase FliI [Aquisalimonas lutea]MDN3518283.1 flagellar protein export ATPase FliI [Aquisalimonas lutea]
MSEPTAQRRGAWLERLRGLEERVEPPRPVPTGVLRRMVGLTLEAQGCEAPVGARCLITTPDGTEVEAEVVGFGDDSLYLMPTGDLYGLTPNARVTPLEGIYEAEVGESLLGRVLDGSGRPIDGAGPLQTTQRKPLLGEAVNPLSRAPIRQPLDTGVRAINGLLTVGRGQRMGLFAGSGVGKSVLLGMMTRYTNADVVVVGLIGERGREVKEFIEDILGEEGLQRSVVVAAPADASPLMRLHGAMQATAVAEHFRDQGKQVLLLMDSLTRYAQAQREIGLSIGEPPTTKGYPPSVFARLPRLVERAGNGPVGGGSITAFYTVLAEGDDQNDPIADAARAILDGHVVLSRELADAGHYPAIDIEASVSRAMPNIVDGRHRELAQRFQQIYGVWQQNRDLINVGAYQRGTDPRVDEAIEVRPRLLEFLQQDLHYAETLDDSIDKLAGVLPGGGA